MKYLTLAECLKSLLHDLWQCLEKATFVRPEIDSHIFLEHRLFDFDQSVGCIIAKTINVQFRTSF